MNSTNRKANRMAKVTRFIIINTAIVCVGLIAGMSLKAGYMLVRFALTTEGNYYEAVFAGFFGVSCLILTGMLFNLIYKIIQDNK